MIDYNGNLCHYHFVNTKLQIGDLVSTVLGEYGIIVDIGEHTRYKSDNTEYYHVLIGQHIYFYLPFALIKIKKNKNNT